ncbi:TBB1-like protein [Mya arenaria]|uniref:TBB1-like protein n=1 Tax=Mya arenaria TaxID=6604 RepID=A0ABY7FMB5_MYAAR|nr:TBB1-like protein [Mya arenaria]
MSTVFLQIGQCGNQVGHSFWKKVIKDEDVKKSKCFLDNEGHLRSVAVDSESKVLKKITRGLPYRKSGDDHLLDDTLNAIRKQVEKCDCFTGIITLHSLTGGTGSGFGSRLTESLREEYPLSHLMSNSDCVVLTHNDDVLYRIQKRTKTEAVSFAHINDAIASHLSGLFLPTDSLRTSGVLEWSRGKCYVLCLQIPDAIQYSSTGAVCVARGDSTGGFLLHASNLEPKLRQGLNCVDWNPFPIDLWNARTNGCGPKGSASLTVAMNSSSIVEYLERVMDRSRVMYDAGAYLHWYWRHGSEQEDFTSGFDTVQTVIDNYKDAIT